jgi:tryptophan 2,3-dioxygenase
MTRTDLINQAVVEAARRVMAAQLRVERAGASTLWRDVEIMRDAEFQDLRDALSSQSRVRARR